MEGLEALVPAGGVAGVLAMVIGYLLNANRRDRQDYRQAVAAEREQRAKAEAETDAVERQLDDERERRRAAEDATAKALAEITGLRQQVKHLEVEVARLTRLVEGGAP